MPTRAKTTMASVDEYRRQLRREKNWTGYLKLHSNLPGPCANLELVKAVAEEGDRVLFGTLTSAAAVVPANTPEEFLVVCGIVGLGRLAAEGDGSVLSTLQVFAGSPSRRIHKAVAMALQRLGDEDFDQLLEVCGKWIGGSYLEKRAVVAAIAEPRLLTSTEHARSVADLVDRATLSVAEAGDDRTAPALRTLRQTLGYAWSVIVAAYPETGKQVFEKWFRSSDPDVQWIVQENLKRKRIAHLGFPTLRWRSHNGT